MPLYKHYSTTQILTRFSVGFVFGCTVSPLKSVTIRSAAMPFAFKTSATLFARFSDKVILMPGLPVSLSAYPVTATLAVGYFSRCFTKDSILASWSSWIFAEFSAKKTLCFIGSTVTTGAGFGCGFSTTGSGLGCSTTGSGS